MNSACKEAEAKVEMNPAEALVSLYLMALVQVSIGLGLEMTAQIP